MKKNFFIDFDGTITKKDSVFAMVETFCRDGWQEINNRWEKGEISTEQCAKETFNLFDATKEDLLELANQIEIDKYFSNFLNVCTSEGDKVTILSDGYDLLIKHILQREGIILPFYSNMLIINNKRFSIKCPYLNNNCGKCGTCKTTLLNRLKEENCLAIYIGDGYSDTCVVKKANLVFAKEPLFTYCRKNKIEAFYINNFNDVIKKLPIL